MQLQLHRSAVAVRVDAIEFLLRPSLRLRLRLCCDCKTQFVTVKRKRKLKRKQKGGKRNETLATIKSDAEC